MTPEKFRKSIEEKIAKQGEKISSIGNVILADVS